MFPTPQQSNPSIKHPTLAYCQLVLEKVHFDPILFSKEYHKSLRWLSGDDQRYLRQWLSQRFGTEMASVYA